MKNPGTTALLAVLLTASSLFAAMDQSLIDAVRGQDKAAVQRLLKQKVDVNAAQPDGTTALSWAVNRDEVEIADLLLRAGAKPNAANEYGVTPLWLAADAANLPMVELLLNAGADARTSALNGETALMRAAHTGSMEIVQKLIARGADVNARDTAKGQTALMRAAAAKHPQIVSALIEHGADVKAYSAGGFTPLLFAAQQGDEETSRILLSMGADVNQAMLKTAKKAVAGLYAPTQDPPPDQGPVASVANLSEGEVPKGEQGRDLRPTAAVGGDLERTPVGTSTPLHIAIQAGHEKLALLLLEKGADPNAVDAAGMTPLHYALYKGINSINGTLQVSRPTETFLFRSNMHSLIRALLDKGANPNAQISRYTVKNTDRMNLLGATPFLLAAASADPLAMKMLLDKGADPVLKTRDGTSPLMVAAGLARTKDRPKEDEKDALEAVRMTFELGNKPDDLTMDGMGAMHGAALTGANDVIRYLVEHGADLNIKTKIGQVPLSVAMGVYPINIPASEIRFALNATHPGTAELLLKLGAKPLVPSEWSLPGEGLAGLVAGAGK